ncbi:hypothetical protein SDC9_115136 [bioreactor metagenome]|uniref:Uncharacterized protein n=1 Tax=bioreactor metagenome TaxID=1076179 RepID=A0A645BSA1_9ZZZZ
MTDTVENEKINLSILISLLFLRFVLLFLSHINFIDSNLGLIIYLLGTFILTGFFICRNIQNLSLFNISGFAIFLFLFSPVFSIISDPLEGQALGGEPAHMPSPRQELSKV